MTVSWLNRAVTLSLRGLVAFGKFWYGFIIGDDWTVAAAVAAALVMTWLLHTAGVVAWWLPPLAAVAATGASLRRSAVDGHRLRRANHPDLLTADHPGRDEPAKQTRKSLPRARRRQHTQHRFR